MNRFLAILTIFVTQVTWSMTVSAQETSSRARTTTRVRPGAVQQASTTKKVKVAPASHEVVYDGDIVLDTSSGCTSCGGSGCQSCSSGCDSGMCESGSCGGTCNSCHAPNRFCICFPAHGWVHAEYLNWYQDGMYVPPLVTTSAAGTAQGAAGVLPGATTLFGNDRLYEDASEGFRIRFGWWLASFCGLGVEGEYTGLAEQTESYFQNSTGNPIIARPFFDVLQGFNNSELVAFPNVVSGSIAVDSTNKFDGAAFRFRKQLFGRDGCGYSPIYGQPIPTSSRLDFTLGYRFWQLKESLRIREDIDSLLTAEPGSFDMTDSFGTRNQFNGGELGFVWQARRGWWSLDTLMRVGIGNVHQTVDIAGSTIISGALANNGTYAGGLLAQTSNIGNYTRNEFTMIPEFGATIGYQLTKRIRMTAGYSMVYWGNVVRPGDQIDLDVNPNLLAPPQTVANGANRPQFQFQETDYWVQGMSFGGEFRW